MPKIRTHKSTQKRFHITSTGKVMRRKAFKSHMLEHKSSKNKRLKNVQHQVSPADVKAIRRLAPYL